MCSSTLIRKRPAAHPGVGTTMKYGYKNTYSNILTKGSWPIAKTVLCDTSTREYDMYMLSALKLSRQSRAKVIEDGSFEKSLTTETYDRKVRREARSNTS